MFPKTPQWIKINASATKSINLERDACDTSLLKRFQITPLVRGTLSRLVNSLEGERVNAWSLTGPYGTGKSSFCNFLLSLFCGNAVNRAICFEKLMKSDEVLGEKINRIAPVDTPHPYGIQVRTVARYEPLNDTLLRGLLSTLNGMECPSPEIAKLGKHAGDLFKSKNVDSSHLLKIFTALQKITEKPLFIVVDELGKNLEYQAHNPNRGDIFALQILAETSKIYLWVCLHQAFAVYSSALTKVQKEEWQKIQGRFEDRSYLEPANRTFSLLKESIELSLPTEVSRNVNVWAKSVEESLKTSNIPEIKDLTEKDIASTYPFHPIAVLLLGELVRRFGQNERTLFSFISSGEPFAFQECVQKLASNYRPGNKVPMLGLNDLYDYFCQNASLRLTDRAENQKWGEIHSIISFYQGNSEQETNLMKTIGVLNLLSNTTGISATNDILHCVLGTEYYREKTLVNRILQDLVKRKILLYRDYAKEYRLWEGSDFDLEKELIEARGRVALREVSQTLEEIAPRSAIVAARHSFQTGTLREFRVKWTTEDEIQMLSKSNQEINDSDGTLWLVLGRRADTDILVSLSENKPSDVFGYSPCLEQVSHLIILASAAQEVCRAPQLERDGIARREAKFRAYEAKLHLENFLAEVFTPGSENSRWYVVGKQETIQSARELSSVISNICDRIYKDSPRINNEMLNVDHLTGAAAAARNRVAEAMANYPLHETIGFQGFGPEVAIYRAVLKDTGLHRKESDGSWKLTEPDKAKQPQFSAVWEKIDTLLNEADCLGELLPVKTIIESLKKPPFGLREGPIPLLLVHYLLVRSDEVAVYEEDGFNPFFGDAEALLLMRRPELFSLRSYKPQGIRSDVVRTYTQVLDSQLKLNEKLRNQTILSVVLPITEFIKSLPDYTKRTRSLSANALRLRNTVLNARDPQKLLFQEIPEAFGLPPFTDETFQTKGTTGIFRDSMNNALNELETAFDLFLKKARERFIAAVSKNMDSKAVIEEEVRDYLRNKASDIASVCLNTELKPILLSFASEKGFDQDWFLQVSSLVMKKPLPSWLDSDLEPFVFLLETHLDQMHHLVELKRISEEYTGDKQNSNFWGILLPGGGLWEKSFFQPSEEAERIQMIVKEPEELNSTDRKILLSWLLEKMNSEGDFQ